MKLSVSGYPASMGNSKLLAVVARTFVAFGIVVFSPAYATTITDSIELPDGYLYPNGVSWMRDGSILVGSVASGDILRVRRDGSSEVWRQGSPEVFAGTSLRYDEDRDVLWVTSPDFLADDSGQREPRPNRITAIRGETREVLWSAEMPDDGFANDIALDGQGGVFVTETLRDRILHIAAPGAPFVTIVEDPALEPSRLGPAGIALLPNGDLVVTLYSTGSLFRVSDGAYGWSLAPIVTKLPIENPDGLSLGPDGRLLVVDGAVASGNGRLLAIDLDAPAPHPVETLLDGLDMPLNLDISGSEVAISEGRLRHVMLPEIGLPVPSEFRIVVVDLEEMRGASE